MTIKGLLCSSFLCLLLGAHQADAATFSWTYTDGGSNTGGGTLTATEFLPGMYTITSVQGTANGDTVVGGPEMGFAGTGTTIFWSPTAPPVFDPLNPFFFTDFAGFAFEVTSNLYYAIYENTALGGPGFFPEYACGLSPYCLLGPGPLGDGLGTTPIGLTNFAVAPSTVPVPAALPLLASGLGALGFFGWRSKRKTA